MNRAEVGIKCAMVSLVRRIGPAGALAIAVLALAVPAQARAAGCPSQPVFQTFQPWLDPAWYVPAPGGDVEGGGGEWTLVDGAAVADGTEPFLAGGRSLTLPAGSSATTAPMCVGVEHPTLRLFARNTGDSASLLAVSVVFRDPLGLRHALPVGMIAAGSRWAPTPVMPVVANLLAVLGDQDVAFRFAPVGDGQWAIDDVWVDPYKKG
jgi:hypothetical protein